MLASRIGGSILVSEQSQEIETVSNENHKLPKIRNPSKYYVFYKQKKRTNPSLYTSIEPSKTNLDASILTENPE